MILLSLFDINLYMALNRCSPKSIAILQTLDVLVYLFGPKMLQILNDKAIAINYR